MVYLQYNRRCSIDKIIVANKALRHITSSEVYKFFLHPFSEKSIDEVPEVLSDCLEFVLLLYPKNILKAP